MSLHTHRPSRRRARRARSDFAPALVALLALLPLAWGCAAHRLGRPEGPAAPAGETVDAQQIRELGEAAARAPAEPYWPYALACRYLAANSTARAEALLDRALGRQPDYAPALALRAGLDYRAGRHDRAIRMLEAELQRPGAFPGGPPRELIQGLALHYEAIGQPDRARSLAASAPAGRADPALVYLTLRGSQPEAATEAAEAAARSDPQNATNQNNYGITRLRAGDPLAARGAFERAVALDSTLAGPYYNLAIVEKFYFLRDDRAAEWFDRYWRRSHEDPDGLAKVFGRAGSSSSPTTGSTR